MPIRDNSFIQRVHISLLKTPRFSVFQCYFINKMLYIWILIIRDTFSLYKTTEHKNDLSYSFRNENTKVQSTSQPTGSLGFQAPILLVLYCSQKIQSPQNCRMGIGGRLQIPRPLPLIKVWHHPQNSTTKWGPSAQTYEPVWIFHIHIIIYT